MPTEKHYVDPGNEYNLPPCTGDGIHPISKNPTRFYTCTRDFKHYDQYIFQCGPKEVYDPILKRCTKDPVIKVHKVRFE